MDRSLIGAGLATLPILAVVAFSGGSPASVAEEPEVIVAEDVLAEVNGAELTAFDLDVMVRDTLGPLSESVLQQEDSRRRALESLVVSRAMSMQRDAELSDEERWQLERRVQAYRDQLLVRQYLDEHAPAAPVTHAMIEEYYASHAERFGGETETRYEMLFATRSLTDAERRRALEVLRSPDAHPDWDAWMHDLQITGLPLAHRADQTDVETLPPRLRETLTHLQPGEGAPGAASPLTLVDGRPFLLRVLSRTHGRPRPLADVRGEIREALSARHLRDAIERAQAQVLSEAEISYR